MCSQIENLLIQIQCANEGFGAAHICTLSLNEEIEWLLKHPFYAGRERFGLKRKLSRFSPNDSLAASGELKNLSTIHTRVMSNFQ
ncbi:MAG: hypothetical protein ACH350_05840 [Parachlamydiaceae bacterium]